MNKRPALGRGLSALMGEQITEAVIATTSGEHQHLSVDTLSAGNYQPRKVFDESYLQELADSIKRSGVLQPIIVRPLTEGGYQIIAGERRWRASKMLGLATIPALIKELTDQEALEFAIIENIQRQDLNPLEEAEGYERLMKEFSYTQEVLAESLGKSRSHIANLLRLLTLPDEIKTYIYNGSLTMGHARSLVNVDNNIAIAERIINEKLSVRQVEQLLRGVSGAQKKKASQPKEKALNELEKDDDIIGLELSLTESLGLRVKIDDSEQGGKISIFFDNVQQLDSILQRLSGSL